MDMEVIVHVEEVKPLIRQKGDLVKVVVTAPFSTELWSKFGPMIGKHAKLEITKVSEQVAGDAAAGQQALPYDGAGDGSSGDAPIEDEGQDIDLDLDGVPPFDENGEVV